MSWRRLPPLHAIRAFEAAARHRSMTRAAEELGVTPGAVSRHVRALEEHLQKALFLRGATGLTPTSAGEALALATRDGLDRIADGASGVRLQRLRRLSIGVYGFFVSRMLLPLWTELRSAHPELAIDLHTSPNPLDLLPGRYDAVIAVSDAAPRAGLITHPLVPISTVPVCAPRWLKRGPLDFAAVPLLHARPRPDDWRRWLDHVGFGSVPAQGGSSFESIGLAIEAAAAGMGAAIAIEALLPHDPMRRKLVIAHPVVRPTRRSFVLQYEARLVDEPALSTFADWLMRRLARDRAT
ncbi:LysR family transcriptional regulator [Bradyrhizobium sp. AUGA SZCCT0177]|uniref:LysR substrate-binding domain-containing protein n=1 Tax=Bradyrhizobium sp. AUGA SZCCT0177 TaxID=2807665 RepID=UPI001BAC8DCF|nr:LysR substrate-binding domain-containing protein [Bradyrhizobium sp. AUGA SZCCT0177]MBR1283346.1 LysR family transcriptional regulator [Bradyrhizobium sp. AUGA SZCCT0177]